MQWMDAPPHPWTLATHHPGCSEPPKVPLEPPRQLNRTLIGTLSRPSGSSESSSRHADKEGDYVCLPYCGYLKHVWEEKGRMTQLLLEYISM